MISLRIALEVGYWLGETLQLGAVLSYEDLGADVTEFILMYISENIIH